MVVQNQMLFAFRPFPLQHRALDQLENPPSPRPFCPSRPGGGSCTCRGGNQSRGERLPHNHAAPESVGTVAVVDTHCHLSFLFVVGAVCRTTGSPADVVPAPSRLLRQYHGLPTRMARKMAIALGRGSPRSAYHRTMPHTRCGVRSGVLFVAGLREHFSASPRLIQQRVQVALYRFGTVRGPICKSSDASPSGFAFRDFRNALSHRLWVNGGGRRSP